MTVKVIFITGRSRLRINCATGTLTPKSVTRELSEAGNKCGCTNAKQCYGNVPAGIRARSKHH